MATFKSSSAADLKLLAVGMCPECGASLAAGSKACGICSVQFAPEHTALIGTQAPKAAAPPPAAAPSAPATAPGVGRAAPAVAAGKGMTPQEFEEMEHGFKNKPFPLTSTAIADLATHSPLFHGVALTSALLVYADAALVDEPEVLMGKPAAKTPIARSRINYGISAAALVDGDNPPAATPPLSAQQQPARPAAPAAGAPPPAAARPPAPPPAAAAPPRAPAPTPPAPSAANDELARAQAEIAALRAQLAAAQAQAGAAAAAPPRAPAPPPPSAPPAASKAAGPDAATGVDPDATLVHDANAIAGIIDEIASGAQPQNVAARGGAVRPIDSE